MPRPRAVLLVLLLLLLTSVVVGLRAELQVQALALHSWLSELADPDFQARMDRLDRILKTRDRSQTAWVVQVIYRDSSWKTRKWAEMALAEAEGVRATPVLVDLLLHAPLWRDRVKPAELLGKYGDPTCVPALILKLDDYDYLVRYWCAKSLGTLRERSAVPALIRMLSQDPEPYPRFGAAQALGEIGDPVAWPYLVRALEDREACVRAYAVQALGKSGHAIAAPVAMRLVRDPDEEVRKQVCLALGTLADPRSRPALEELARDPAPQVQFLARRALKRLPATQAAEPLEPRVPRRVRDF